jgi:hypothetical protein
MYVREKCRRALCRRADELVVEAFVTAEPARLHLLEYALTTNESVGTTDAERRQLRRRRREVAAA